MSRRKLHLALAVCALSLGAGSTPATSLPSLRHVAVGVLTLNSGDDVTIIASDGYGEDTGFARVNEEEMILACLVIVERDIVPLHELYASGRSLDSGKTWRIYIRQSQTGASAASVSDTAGIGHCDAQSPLTGVSGAFTVVP